MGPCGWSVIACILHVLADTGGNALRSDGGQAQGCKGGCKTEGERCAQIECPPLAPALCKAAAENRCDLCRMIAFGNILLAQAHFLQSMSDLHVKGTAVCARTRAREG